MNYDSVDDFKHHIPNGCPLVFIEQSGSSKPINDFTQPKSATYVLGAEDEGVPQQFMQDEVTVHAETPMCLNVAVAGSLVMFHRKLQSDIRTPNKERFFCLSARQSSLPEGRWCFTL